MQPSGQTFSHSINPHNGQVANASHEDSADLSFQQTHQQADHYQALETDVDENYDNKTEDALLNHNNNPLSRCQFVTRFFMREFMSLQRFILWQGAPYSSGPFRLHQAKASSWHTFRIGFVKGASAVTHNIWMPLSGILWLIDSINTCLPSVPNFQNKKGWAALNFFIGFSRNYDAGHGAMLANMGGDVPFEQDDFIRYTAIFLCAAVACGLVKGFYYVKTVSNPTLNTITREIFPSQDICSDLIKNLPLAGQLSRVIDRAEFKVLSSPSADIRNNAFSKLKELAEGHYALTRVSALSALTNIIDNTLEDGIRRQSLEALHAATGGQNSFFVRAAAILLEGAVVQSNRPLLAALFALMYGYAAYHLGRILLTKFIEIIQQNVKDGQCHGTYASFMGLMGNYACVVTDTVYYELGQSSQKFLDALMRTPQTSERIKKALESINHAFDGSPRRFVSTLDFSRQDWPSWNEEAVHNIFVELLEPAFRRVEVLNFSAPIPAEGSFNLDTNVALQFIESHDITHLDFHNRHFAQPSYWLCDWITLSVQYLDLSYTGVGDQFVQRLSTLLPYRSIAYLNLGGNTLGYGGAYALSAVLPRSPILSLDIHDNGNVEPDDISVIFDGLQNSRVTRLDVSDIDLSGLDPEQIGESIANSQLKSLVFGNTQLLDFQMAGLIPYLSASQIEHLDLSNNDDLTDYSLAHVLKMSVNHTLISINLSGTALADQTMLAFQAIYLESGLTTLDFSHTQASSRGFNTFFQHMPTSLASLTINGIPMATSVSELIQALQFNETRLTHLNLANIGLTGETASDFVQSIPLTHIESLTLDDNPLKESGSYLSAMIKNSKNLKRLSIANTALETTAFQNALLSAAKSRLIAFIAPNAGELSDPTLQKFAREIIEDVSEAETLGGDLSVDMSREINRANSMTQLRELDISNHAVTATLTDVGIRALCQTIYRSGLSVLAVSIQQGAGVRDYQCFLSGPDLVQRQAFTDDPHWAQSATIFPSERLIVLTSIALLALIFYTVCKWLIGKTGKDRCRQFSSAFSWFNGSSAVCEAPESPSKEAMNI